MSWLLLAEERNRQRSEARTTKWEGHASDLKICTAPQREWSSKNDALPSHFVVEVYKVLRLPWRTSLRHPKCCTCQTESSSSRDPPEPQIIRKTQWIATLSCTCIFFLLTLSLLWFSFFFSSLLWLFPPPLFHLSILSEVWFLTSCRLAWIEIIFLSRSSVYPILVALALRSKSIPLSPWGASCPAASAYRLIYRLGKWHSMHLRSNGTGWKRNAKRLVQSRGHGLHERAEPWGVGSRCCPVR